MIKDDNGNLGEYKFPPLPNTLDGACWALRLISDGEIAADFPEMRVGALEEDSVWKKLVDAGYVTYETDENARHRRHTKKNQLGCGRKFLLTPLGVELLDEAWGKGHSGSVSFPRSELLIGLHAIGPGAKFRKHRSVAVENIE